MLFLFDIDGTLVAGATDAHRGAAPGTARGPRRRRGRGRPSLAPAGRTDGEIARSILLAAGVSAERIDDRAEDVREVCCREYTRRATEDLSHTVLPGIRSLLEWLGSLDGVTLGLVTGNYECVARRKLSRAGLGAVFPAGIGGFGSDHEDRASLPAIARRRAGERGGHTRGRRRSSSATRPVTSRAPVPTSCAALRSRPDRSEPRSSRAPTSSSTTPTSCAPRSTRR